MFKEHGFIRNFHSKMYYLLPFFTLFGYITSAKVVTKNSKNMSFRVVAFGTSDSKTLHIYLWSLPMFKKRKSYKAVQKKAAAKSYINEIQKQIIRKHKIKAMPVL